MLHFWWKYRIFFILKIGLFIDFSPKYRIFFHSFCFQRIKAIKGPPGHNLLFSCLGQANERRQGIFLDLVDVPLFCHPRQTCLSHILWPCPSKVCGTPELPSPLKPCLIFVYVVWFSGQNTVVFDITVFKAILNAVRVIIKKDSGTQKKDSRRTPFLAK